MFECGGDIYIFFYLTIIEIYHIKSNFTKIEISSFGKSYVKCC